MYALPDWDMYACRMSSAQHHFALVQIGLEQVQLGRQQSFITCILQEAPKSSSERGDEQPSWSQKLSQ